MNALSKMMAAQMCASDGLRKRMQDEGIPPEIRFARDFVQEQQILSRPIACHGENCGFIEPDVMPGQDYAVGAAFDLLYGYFQRATQQLNLPEPPAHPDCRGEETGE